MHLGLFVVGGSCSRCVEHPAFLAQTCSLHCTNHVAKASPRETDVHQSAHPPTVLVSTQSSHSTKCRKPLHIIFARQYCKSVLAYPMGLSKLHPNICCSTRMLEIATQSTMVLGMHLACQDNAQSCADCFHSPLAIEYHMINSAKRGRPNST